MEFHFVTARYYSGRRGEDHLEKNRTPQVGVGKNVSVADDNEVPVLPPEILAALSEEEQVVYVMMTAKDQRKFMDEHPKNPKNSLLVGGSPGRTSSSPGRTSASDEWHQLRETGVVINEEEFQGLTTHTELRETSTNLRHEGGLVGGGEFIDEHPKNGSLLVGGPLRAGATTIDPPRRRDNVDPPPREVQADEGSRHSRKFIDEHPKNPREHDDHSDDSYDEEDVHQHIQHGNQPLSYFNDSSGPTVAESGQTNAARATSSNRGRTDEQHPQDAGTTSVLVPHGSDAASPSPGPPPAGSEAPGLPPPTSARPPPAVSAPPPTPSAPDRGGPDPNTSGVSQL